MRVIPYVGKRSNMTDRELLIENTALAYYNHLDMLELRYVKASAFNLCRQLAKTMTDEELVGWRDNLEAVMGGRLPPYYPLKEEM